MGGDTVEDSDSDEVLQMTWRASRNENYSHSSNSSDSAPRHHYYCHFHLVDRIVVVVVEGESTVVVGMVVVEDL